MTKAKILLVFAFLIVCAAGVVVGTAVDRHVRPDVMPPERVPFPELKLSAEQQAKMKSIWEPVMRIRHQSFTTRRTLEQQRFDKLLALLTPEQKAEYGKIQADIDRQTKDAEDQIHQATQVADAQMHAILTDAQFAELQKMRKNTPHGMGPPPMGGPPMGGPGMGPSGHHHEHGEHGDRHHMTTYPTTAPSSESL
jgi:hypothetical protein